MRSRIYFFLRNVRKIQGRTFCTTAEAKEQPQTFRTIESNPANHNDSHLGRFYTIPKDIHKCLYQKEGLPKGFQMQAETFAECSILVRKPATEIISYLKQADYSKPINRYVLYGQFGTGKSISLAHIIHYAFMEKFIVLHVPWPNIWFRFPKEVTNSTLVSNAIDLPVDAGFWLKYFKCQNQQLLSTLNLKVSKDYEWSAREVTKQGDSLIQLIDFGITRIKFACGVVETLIKELKQASTAGKCKTLIVIDGFNAFCDKYTGVKDDTKKMVKPNKITLANSFVSGTHYDWCNGAAVLTVDIRATKERRESDFPRYLLGNKGFEHLDPFVPVLVENYTPDEFETVMEYYKNRKWVREISPKGQKELELLSNRNPFSLYERCKPL